MSKILTMEDAMEWARKTLPERAQAADAGDGQAAHMLHKCACAYHSGWIKRDHAIRMAYSIGGLDGLQEGRAISIAKEQRRLLAASGEEC